MLALAWADPPPPSPELRGYVRCENVATLRKIPRLVPALEATGGIDLPLDAPQIAPDRPVVLAYGTETTAWLPTTAPLDLPGWTYENGWAIARAPSTLADVPAIGNIRAPDVGCVVRSGVRPVFSDDADRRTLVILRADGSQHWQMFGRHRPGLTHSAVQRGEPEPVSDPFAVVVVDDHGRLYLPQTLLPALKRLDRSPIRGHRLLDVRDGVRLAVIPFERPWLEPDIDALAKGLGAKRDNDVLVFHGLFLKAVGRRIVVADDRGLLDEMLAAIAKNQLVPHLQALVRRRLNVFVASEATPVGTWQYEPNEIIVHAPTDPSPTRKSFVAQDRRLHVDGNGTLDSVIAARDVPRPAVLDPEPAPLNPPWDMLPPLHFDVRSADEGGATLDVALPWYTAARDYDREILASGWTRESRLALLADRADASYTRDGRTLNLDVRPTADGASTVTLGFGPGRPIDEAALRPVQGALHLRWLRLRPPIVAGMVPVFSDMHTLTVVAEPGDPATVCAGFRRAALDKQWIQESADGATWTFVYRNPTDDIYTFPADGSQMSIACRHRDGKTIISLDRF